ncbi:methyl-coenzyme M reductase I subunit alpha [Candidatus Methanoplasma termitum]|uniref:coenzyme-B sulfoethylthiotransferase n=2 Tax=Methanomassiliicoccales TaxID=1235850 RepID=A0A0A7LF46_9ARCH|nr:coenzyme-B sulfoethylthiotransferase subunit alpha [Candidatus Methanoplasma termitum]AIZ56101.1 methyl-coenzyme M reductase I subunit alpha [Candidatus Methanoplasma termitum]MCL2334201.1 coenzyme-B sulfoethylthiotransferase subunit alpha [Candidatus Methanoplasma sp.]
MAAKQKDKLFMDAVKKKFKEDPTDMETKYYCYGGWRQSKSKVEFQKAAQAIAKKRGFPMMNEDIGVPLGQRAWMPYQLSHTDIYVEVDDLHCINNPAIQQAWDDIRRTILVGLNSPHETIEKRLGKEVTPETINNYLEAVNHTMPGGAIVQEHMAECNPALVSDSYVKVYSGDDELIDEIDKRFVIDINKLFPKAQADQLKKAIGKNLMQAVRVPTMVGRLMDGATVSRHAAMQISMAFISSYKLAAGEAAIADFAYSAKHLSINMGTMMPARRARGPNEPGGIPFGFFADMLQSDRVYPNDPARAVLETVGLGAAIFDQVYLGGYMSGGVGFTQYASATYTDNILEDYVYHAVDVIKDKYGGLCKLDPSKYDELMKLGDDVNAYALEMYEKYPAIMETHFGGSQRATVAAATTGIAGSMATGIADCGLNMWYLSMLQHKERTGRLGFYGYDLQDQCGSANSFSYRSDEGLPAELRGPNYPNYAMNVGHLSGYSGIAKASHVARGDAFTANPYIRVAFADPSLVFDFANVTKEIGRGGLREFVPAGERTAVIKG